jgi:hypothetical protein
MSACFIALLAAGATVYEVANRTLEIHIPRATVQHAIDARLPLSHAAGPLRYGIDAVRVVLKPDGQVDLHVQARIEVQGRTVEAQLRATAGVAYRDAGIWLANLKPGNVRIQHPGTGKLGPMAGLATRLTRMIDWQPDAEPEAADPPPDLAGMAVEAPVIELLQSMLDREPIFRLDEVEAAGRTGTRAVIRAVHADNDVLVVVIDPVAALWRALGKVVM